MPDVCGATRKSAPVFHPFVHSIHTFYKAQARVAE